MGAILKYTLYIILILLVYIIAKDIYYDKINSNSTIVEVKEQIADSAHNMIDSGIKTIENKAENLQKTK